MDKSLSRQAMRLALFFQHLGYFGRCSFDAVITGKHLDAAAIRWIECNARWGGVSVPMSFANRGGLAHGYAIIQDGDLSFRPRRFEEVLAEFSDLKAPPDLCRGIVFLSPNRIEAGTGCHFLSFGASRAAALKQSQEVLRRLQDR